MPALSDEDRPALLDELLSLKNALAGWGGTLGVLGAASAVLSPALVLAPIGVGAVVVAVLKRKQNAVERVLDDPPRFDYEKRTRARSRRYVRGMLGEDPLAVAGDRVAVATLRVVAYLEAAVRADERAQGAREHGREDLMSAQMDEAARLFEEARRAEAVFAQQLEVLAIEWGAVAADNQLAMLPVPIPGDRVPFPRAARAALRRSGLVVSDLDLSIELEVADRDLLQGAFRTRRFGDVVLTAAQRTRELARASMSVAGRAGEVYAVSQVPRRVREDYTLGRQARERGDLDRAMHLLRRAAELGLSEAMFELAVLESQRGDFSASEEWLRRAQQAMPSEAMSWPVDLKPVAEPPRLLPGDALDPDDTD